MSETETLKEQCERELQKQLLRRLKKLSFVVANLRRLKPRIKNSPLLLLELTQLTKHEERISDAHFDSLKFAIVGGRVQSRLRSKKFIRRLVWEQ